MDGEASRVQPELTVGVTLGRYQVRRLLGRGGMGRVYLARDVTLGRSVALKVIGDTRDAGRFLDEALAIARLNHPHIVQLYDFQLHRESLVLALEYIEGATLKERAEEHLELDEIFRHLRAISEALVHAHASGVLHCDLKPNNVMIGRDGRVRVVDFGLAQIDSGHRGVAGTPDWMAPEQWDGGALSSAVDVWALGMIAACLLEPTHPLGADSETRRRTVRDRDRDPTFATSRADVPGSIIDLISRSLEYDPAARPTAADWLQTLDEALAGRDDHVEERPYLGLAAFEERHCRNYFGRELEIDEFLERLRESPCLPIVGHSGAGKSSFLHAGVVPRLRKRGRLHVLAFRPGADPITALSRQLLDAMGISDRDQVRTLRDELVATPQLLAARLMTLALSLDTTILVAVDQLEEVYTQGCPDAEQVVFTRMLLEAADDPRDPVRIVFTVRDDFVGRFAKLRTMFVVQPLDEVALRRTIVGPLARYRYELEEPSIVDDLLAEVVDAGSSALPLLQFACSQLWDDRDRETRTLRRSTYRAMGGLAGALGRYAERALAQLSTEGKTLARKVLLHLVAGQARRTLRRQELLSLVGVEAGPIVDVLVQSRLLVQRTSDDSGQPSIEIAHESLLITWDQLARWLEETRDERRLLDELDAETRRWEQRGADADATLAKDELVAARTRLKQLEMSLPPRIERFLAAGESRHRGIARRRQRRSVLAIAVSAVISVVVGVMIARYLDREHKIETNLGTLELAVAAFDRVDQRTIPVAASELGLRYALYEADPKELFSPGKPLPARLFEIEPTTMGVRIIAPGGVVFLAISNRGRHGEVCGPSWIRIQNFPGYTTAPQRYAIEVPTCQASRYDTVAIPAGDFYYGGPGEAPSKMYGERDFTMPERVVSLPAFAIDRTELSNGAYAPFARLAPVTGVPIPTYSHEPMLAHGDEPDRPVTSVDSYAAEAYCRYLGKQLPTDAQWVKAARGGTIVNGQPNPMPKRLYPWGSELKAACVNDDGADDGFGWVSPVDSFDCGKSPYGVLNLVGNVQEWISRIDQPEPENPLSVQRGGGVDAPPEMELTTTIFVNRRLPRDFTYSTGFRCADNN